MADPLFPYYFYSTKIFEYKSPVSRNFDFRRTVVDYSSGPFWFDPTQMIEEPLDAGHPLATHGDVDDWLKTCSGGLRTKVVFRFVEDDDPDTVNAMRTDEVSMRKAVPGHRYDRSDRAMLHPDTYTI